MQRLWSKAIAAMLIAILLSFNCITTGVYAANIIEQNNETSEKNITFDVKVGNESSHEAYEYTADIDSTDTNLYLNIGVKNTGYLKDISVNLENSNYKLDFSKIDDSKIKNITDYTVELNQINTGKTVELVIPIIPTMNDSISVDELGKDSTIKFKATYINEDNKEDTIEKDMTVHLNWTASQENLVGELSQNVIRYLNYDGKTMLSLLLSDALKDSKLPVSSKEINIKVPMINDLKPTEVIVTAIDTLATNGQADGVEFTNNNYTYDSEKGTLTINVKNEANEQGLVSWVKGSPDKFVITYIYATNTNEKALDIHTETTTNTTLLNGTVVTANMQEQDYTIDSKIGDIATIEVVPETASLNKGYMYSNRDKEEDQIETEFGVKYILNVGLAEALNDITIKENGDFLNDINASEYIYDKKVSVSKDELIKVLGEDGSINVLTSDGTTIGTLNKDTLELDINNSNISFVTSKPQTEGEITLNITKAIKGNLDYTKGQISSFKTLSTKVQINNESVGEISLEEPTSKVNMEISNNNLSTVVTNENVVMNITLERDDVTDNLFSNPELNITFPEEVTNIEAKDATLLYEDELVSENLNVNGRTINLKLDGTETKYSSQSTSKGTVIRLVLDLTLNNLSPSKQTNISLSYTNDNDNYLNIVEEENINTVELPVNVVAPTGFVTTQSIYGYNGDEKVTAQEEEAIGKLPVLSDAKTATISGTIVNNLGKDAEGLKILGRIPFKGNKQVDGSSDLGSTFDTVLAGNITVEGLDATIYYSANGEATVDLENSTNGWSTEYIEDAKSFMVVANNTVESAATFNFSYNINIPANVDYANIAKAAYGVYYYNNAEEGNKQNVVLASVVGLKTEDKAELSVNISANKKFTGETIEQNTDISEGEYITYNVSITNTSNQVAENAKASIELPEGFARLQVTDLGIADWPLQYEKIYTSPYEVELGTIDVGETKNISVDLVAGNITNQNELERIVRVTVTADKMNGEAVGIFTTTINKGYVTGLLTVTYENQNVDPETNLEYTIKVENVNSEEKNNVIVNMTLPEGLEYISSVMANEEYEGNYNESTRELTFNISKLESRKTNYITIMAKTIESKNEILQTKASIICDGMSSDFYTNTVTVYYGTPKVEATLSSNITQGNLLDSDIIEYYIDVKNTGNIPARVSIANTTPAGLLNNSYSIEVSDGERVNKENFTSSYVSETVNLQLGGNARLTIVTKPVAIASGTSKEVTVLPKVNILKQYSEDILEEVSINSLTHKIQGTGGTNTPGVEGSYRIMGTAWIDTNKDGIKNTEESRLANIEVVLYDTQGYIAKDANGNELKSITNEDGQYFFENLNSGNYQIVAHIDTFNYIVTTYHIEGALESQNSDFVDATLDGNPVAATDILKLTNYNLYNIDLGLQEREKFDFKLDKMVSKVTVTNTKLDTKTYEYNSNFAMVSLLNTYVEYSTVLIEYNITVTNEGKIAGYVEEIIDYIPEGMAFSSDLNTNWYLGSDGNLYTTSLANTLIEPGESKTVTLTLTRKMTGENTGTVVNTAEISKVYNEYGLEDGDSTPGNKKDGEDDISTATTLLTMSTGKEIASFLGITLGTIAIVGLAVFIIKKYVIKRI